MTESALEAGWQRPARALLQRRRALGLGAALLLSAAAGGVALSRARGPAPEGPAVARRLPVTVRHLEPADGYRALRSYTGAVRALRASELGFEGAGTVVEVAVAEGEEVDAGALLARLDTRHLDARRRRLAAERDRAAADLRRLEAGPRVFEVDRARAEVRALGEQLALAELRSSRRAELVRRGAVASEIGDEAALEASALAARLDAARHALAELEAGTRRELVEAARAAVAALDAALAEVDVELAKAELRAPFAGTVGARRRDEGEIVGPGAPIVRLIERGAREAWFGVPEEVAARLSPRAPVDVRVAPGEGGLVRGEVTAALPEVDGPTRTATVVVRLPASASAGGGASGAAAPLREGRMVRLEVAEQVPATGFWVPVTALSHGDEGLWQLLGVEPAPARGPGPGGAASGDARVVPHHVELIYTDGDRALVRGTIDAGSAIVVDGAHRVTVGQVVDARVGAADAPAPAATAERAVEAGVDAALAVEARR